MYELLVMQYTIHMYTPNVFIHWVQHHTMITFANLSNNKCILVWMSNMSNYSYCNFHT
jgi:hypothetical protein